MRRKGGFAGAMAILMIAVLAIAAAPVQAAATRAEYIAQVDPICQQAFHKVDQTIAGFKPKRDGRRNVVRIYSQINGILDPAFAQIAGVPPAPGDEATIAAWLAEIRDFQSALHGVVRAARQGNRKRALALARQAGEAGDRADGQVAIFGFQHCA